MDEKSSIEGLRYSALGASSSKHGILKATGESNYARYFATPIINENTSPPTATFLHSDGAGTKSIVAYLMFKETGDPSYFRTLAYDSLIMNLDDVAASGGIDHFLLSNTIGRNKKLIPDEAIAEIITGYKECVEMLANEGITVTLTGGETADIGDLVRTLVVDSTLFAKTEASYLVDTWRVKPGDLIVGFSSYGRARFETRENSGIGSNGLTLARHTLLSSHYPKTYPESVDTDLPKEISYTGKYRLQDTPADLKMTIGQALLSPTRTYTPIIKKLLSIFGSQIHSLIHCTGGGQTKIKRFGRNVTFEKTDLFQPPPIFSLIQEAGRIPWSEMYAVFNMGHRLEACIDPKIADDCIALAKDFGIAGKVIGQVTSTKEKNEVIISSPYGKFVYS